MDDIIYNRRSIRKFQNKEVPFNIIEQIIDAGRMAPSAKNRQPWKYIVLTGKNKDEFIKCMEIGIQREESGTQMMPHSQFGIPDAKNTVRVMKEAPLIIVVLNTNGKSPFHSIDADKRIMEICDSLSIGASIQNILLKATEIGLGTLWIANTCFAYQEIESYLKIEDQLIGAIAVGYAGETNAQRPRKSLDVIAEFR